MHQERRRRAFIRRRVAKQIITPQLFGRICRLFLIYGEIPVSHFPFLYRKHYNEIFDVEPWGYREGLIEFFYEFSNLLIIKDLNDEVPIYALSEKYLKNSSLEPIATTESKTAVDLIRERKRLSCMTKLTNPDCALWTNFQHLLKIEKSRINIDLSPLQLASLRDPYSTRALVAGVHETLRRHPEGIRLDELMNHCQIDLRLLGAPDICTLVSQCPELFHERDGMMQKTRVYDGRTITYEDLDTKLDNSQALAAESILSGIYQKTLLLLLQARMKGLKLGVWYSSLESSFGELELIAQPLDLAKALRDEGLLELRTGTYFKNDLMIDFPLKLDGSKYIGATCWR